MAGRREPRPGAAPGSPAAWALAALALTAVAAAGPACGDGGGAGGGPDAAPDADAADAGADLGPPDTGTPDAGPDGSPGPDGWGAWHVVHEGLASAALGVWGRGPDDLWVVGVDHGEGPLVLHRDAAGWQRLDTGAEGDLWWVFGPDDAAVYLVGEGGLLLRWDRAAARFDRLDAGTDATLFGVWGASGDELWAVGGDPSPADGPGVVVRIAGEAAAPVADLPAALSPTATLFKVWGTAADDVWVVGEEGAVLHRDATGWRLEDPGTTSRLVTVHGADGRLVAVGGAAAARVVERDAAGAWSDRSPPGQPLLNGVFVRPGGRGLAVGAYGTALARDGWGAPWLAAPEPPLPLDWHAAFVDGAGDAWVVGGRLLSAAQLDQGAVLCLGGASCLRGEPLPPPDADAGPADAADAGPDADPGDAGPDAPADTSPDDADASPDDADASPDEGDASPDDADASPDDADASPDDADASPDDADASPDDADASLDDPDASADTSPLADAVPDTVPTGDLPGDAGADGLADGGDGADAAPDAVPGLGLVLGRLGPDDLFVPLADADVLEVVQGPQGGIHLEVALRFQAPGLPATLFVAVAGTTTSEAGEPWGQVTIPKLVAQGAGGVYTTQVLTVFFLDDSAATYLGDPPTPTPAVVCVTATLGGGPSDEACVTVTLVDEE